MFHSITWKVYECKVCGRMYKTRHEAKRHVRTKHRAGDNNIEVVYWKKWGEDQ